MINTYTEMVNEIRPQIRPKRQLYTFVSSFVTMALLLGIILSSARVNAGTLGQHDMVGGRIGIWVNTGDKGDAVGSFGVEQQVSDANIFGELFYSHAFSNFFRADLGLGVSNRSEIVATENTLTGAVNIYPVQVALRFYPLGGLSIGKMHPYVLGGAGLYIGSQTGSSFRSLGFSSTTATDLNYVVGGGVDIPIAETIALTAAGKYYQIDFGSDGFLGLQNYSGYSITIGAAYLFPLGGKDDN